MSEPEARPNPYVGPRTYTEKDSAVFFGRDQEARDLLARVVSERLLLFYAQSGAGKSSLINARLAPGLREEGFAVLPVGRVSGVLPPGVDSVGNIYLFNLMLSLDQGENAPNIFAQLPLPDFLARLTTENGELWRYEPLAAALAPASGGQPYVLIIDQFEEIVTAHPGRWPERQVFFAELDRAMRTDPNLWVVLTLREDYVAALDPFAALMTDRLRARYYMERMGVEAALEAVREPAKSGGRPFAPGVAEKLVDDLRQVRVPGQEKTAPGKYVEPVQLQVVCYQLWERLMDASASTDGSESIGEADLAGAGDVNQALTQFYEATLAMVLADPQVAAAGVTERGLRQWFDRELITTTGIRGTVFRDETGCCTGTLPNVAVDALSRRFLVRTELRAGGAWVELVHDRFVEPVRLSNAAWRRRNLSPLQQQAALWQSQGRPPSLLLSGDALKDAEAWAADHAAELQDHERAFLQECIAARAAAERAAAARKARTDRIIRALAGAASIIAVIALIAAVLAASGQRAASESQQVAVTRAAEASLAKSTAEAGATAAATAQVHAQTEAERAKAQEATAVAARATAEADRKQADTARAGAEALSYLTSAQSAVAAGTLPQRSTLLSVGSVRLARQQNVLQRAGGLEQMVRTLSSIGGLPLREHTASVRTLALSPDGRWLASGSDDGKLLLWDVRQPFTAPVRLNPEDAAPVLAAAFSPDGRWLAAGGASNTVEVWRMTDAPALVSRLEITGRLLNYRSLQFSPGGRWLLASPSEGQVRLWNMTGDKPAAPLLLDHDRSRTDLVTAVFTADEQKLMTRGQDGGVVKLWQAADLFARPVFTQTYGYMADAVLSPDGNWLAIGTAVSLILQYVGDQANAPRTPVREDSRYPYRYTLAFSPDSRTLTSGAVVWHLASSGDWDEPKALVAAPEGDSGTPEFSSDGRWLVAIGNDFNVYRWDMNTPEQLPYVYRGHESPVTGVALSAGGDLLASGDASGEVRLWNPHSPFAGPSVLHHDGDLPGVWLMDASAADPSRTATLLGPREPAPSLVALSDDGRYVATTPSNAGGDILLWDRSPAVPRLIRLQSPGAIGKLAFSPPCSTETNGNACRRWLFANAWGGTLRLWNLQAPTDNGFQTIDFVHNTYLRDFAVAANGRTMVTSTEDGLARVWRLDPPDPQQQPVVLDGHGASLTVHDVAVSASGRWVLTGTWENDYAARLWDLEKSTEQPMKVLDFKGRLFLTGFSPDERWAAAASWDTTAQLVRLADPSQPPVVLDLHRGRILSMAFSPDSHWLATSGEDRRIILWDLTANDPSSSYAVLRPVTGSTPGVQVSFSPDSRWLVGYGAAAFSAAGPWLVTADNDVHLWSIGLDELLDRACLAVGRDPTREEWQRLAPERPYTTLCPPDQNKLLLRIKAQRLVEEGNSLALAGEDRAALARYRDAQTLDPGLGLKDDNALHRQLAAALVADGENLARQGNAEAARKLFSAAVEEQPGLELDPEAAIQGLRQESEQATAARIRQAVQAFISRDDYGGAIATVQRLARDAPTVPITSTLPADTWNSLCWSGAIAGFADAVLPACDRAVSLDVQDGAFRDSRGLARALSGRTPQAIEDFEFFVRWAKETNQHNDIIPQREAWIADLKAGKRATDIFTSSVLQELRQQ